MLGPGTPMLFQGQEFGATTPFLFFCFPPTELCERVNAARREFLAQFPSYSQPDVQKSIAQVVLETFNRPPSIFPNAKPTPGSIRSTKI